MLAPASSRLKAANSMSSHRLHAAVGDVLQQVQAALPADVRSQCTLIKDPACLGAPCPEYTRKRQQIPIFGSATRGNDTEYCNVDALLLLNGRIKVMVEIEESAVDPVQIFGKFFASVAGQCYIHKQDGDVPIYKDDRVLFVQVVRSDQLEPASSKPAQWQNMEAAIRSFLPLGNIHHYSLLAGSASDFQAGQVKNRLLAECVQEVLTAPLTGTPPVTGTPPGAHAPA